MLFERIISEGISHNSYLIGSGGRAAVIDPRRDGDIYLRIASRHGLAITHIFETHRNEDYVIGSLELEGEVWCRDLSRRPVGICLRKAGSRRVTGSARDHWSLLVQETPGHTEESISLVLYDKEISDRPYMIFCGDTLFSGEVARTDFFGQERKAEMAAKIYDSITRKIMPLGDGVIVCPAHGAGSVCGTEIADHPFTTVGYEKETNPGTGARTGGIHCAPFRRIPVLPPLLPADGER